MSPTARPPDVQSTRDRLLARLRGAPCTVEELARAMAVTPNAIRSQLAALGRDGLVTRQGVRHGKRAGKPPVLYAVTRHAQAQFSKAYAPALTAVAEVLAMRYRPDELRELFGAAGTRLAAPAERLVDGDAPQVAKALLESLGGAATVHLHGRHAVVQGVACPIAAAVRVCRESCELVRALLAHTTGVPVATECSYDDIPTCRFQVG
jgi:predicted ArsR family transcriptional regulator